MPPTLIQEQIGAKDLSSVRSSQYKRYAFSVAAGSAFTDNFADVGADLQTKCGIKLPYDGGTAAFNVGSILTGADSLTTGTIVRIDDSVEEGIVELVHVSGSFQNDEVISDDGSVPGAAVVNGTVSLIVDYRVPALSGFIVSSDPIQIKFNSLNEETIEFDTSVMTNIWTFTRGDLLLDKIYMRRPSSPFGAASVQIFVCGSKYIQTEY